MITILHPGCDSSIITIIVIHELATQGPAQVLRAAYDNTLVGTNAKAAKHDKAPKTIARYQRAVAFVWSICQAKLLAFLVERVKTLGTYVLTDDLMSDETKQHLRLDLGSSLLPEQCANAPHIFVARRQLTIDTSIDGVDFSLLFRYVPGPAPMLSTSAGALHAVMNVLNTPCSMKAFNEAFMIMARNAGCAWYLKARTLDGAGGNLKYIAHEAFTDRNDPKSLLVMKHCHLHSTSIANSATANGCFASLPENLYVGCKFFRMGAFFIRMLMAVHELCDEKVCQAPSPPPPVFKRVVSAFSGLLCLTHI